ncbi:hypothetical protein NKI54_35215 [Mesorhizobium sp. M0663]|uniref:hypothetical protein n=1 Tax=Mesorhizobium sp. M0663 TaxID=2956981 RepID=UPI00333C0671
MTVLAYNLAADAKGTWRVVFVPEDLHLYVEFSRPNAESNPVDWLSVDDFLAWRPKGALHQDALDRLVALFCQAMRGQSPPHLSARRALLARSKAYAAASSEQR